MDFTVNVGVSTVANHLLCQPWTAFLVKILIHWITSELWWLPSRIRREYYHSWSYTLKWASGQRENVSTLLLTVSRYTHHSKHVCWWCVFSRKQCIHCIDFHLFSVTDIVARFGHQRRWTARQSSTQIVWEKQCDRVFHSWIISAECQVRHFFVSLLYDLV